MDGRSRKRTDHDAEKDALYEANWAAESGTGLSLKKLVCSTEERRELVEPNHPGIEAYGGNASCWA